MLAITPGLSILYVTGRTLAGGYAEGVASSLGTGLGGLVHILVGGFGVSGIILSNADLFVALKFIGAAYLTWIGWRIFKSARRDISIASITAVHAVGSRSAFREGILVEALNPKTAAFFIAFIPQFVDPSRGDVALQFIVLGSISVALNTLVDIVAAFAAGRVRQAVATRPNLIRRLLEASGGMMIVLGIGLVLARGI